MDAARPSARRKRLRRTYMHNRTEKARRDQLLSKCSSRAHVNIACARNSTGNLKSVYIICAQFFIAALQQQPFLVTQFRKNDSNPPRFSSNQHQTMAPAKH